MSRSNPNPAGVSRRKLLGGICAAALTVSVACGSIGQTEAATAGGTYVVKAGADLIRAAKSGSGAAFKSLLKRYIDVNSMAMFALGKHRKKLPAGQTAEYIALVENFMVYTLSQFSKKFKGREFEVVNSRKSGRGLSVETKLKFLGGKQQKVTWKLVGSGGNYRVADINFQGVWLAGLLRSTFSSLIKKNGNSVTGLISYLRSAAPGNAKIKSDFKD